MHVVSSTLELPLRNLTQKVTRIDPHELPERDKVKRREEHVERAEGNHRGDPATRVLERKGLIRHAILARLAAGHEVHVPGTENLCLRLELVDGTIDTYALAELARRIRPLLTIDNDKVIVSEVAALMRRLDA